MEQNADMTFSSTIPTEIRLMRMKIKFVHDLAEFIAHVGPTTLLFRTWAWQTPFAGHQNDITLHYIQIFWPPPRIPLPSPLPLLVFSCLSGSRAVWRPRVCMCVCVCVYLHLHIVERICSVSPITFWDVFSSMYF